MIVMDSSWARSTTISAVIIMIVMGRQYLGKVYDQVNYDSDGQQLSRSVMIFMAVYISLFGQGLQPGEL